MGKRKKQASSAELAQTIVEAIQEKKGEDVVLMNLKSISASVCDYFVICTANSDTQVKAISEEIEKAVKHKHGENVFHKEGHQNALWVLLDYFNVVAHIFQRSTREYYNLEGLWADAKVEEVAVA